MKIIVIFYSLLLFFISARSQKIFIKDSLNKNAIENVSLIFELKNGNIKVLGFTDKDGYINLDSIVSKNDSVNNPIIKISCVSYRTHFIHLSEIKKNLITFFLAPISAELQEVTVSNSTFNKTLLLSPNKNNQSRTNISATSENIIGRIFEVGPNVEIYKIKEIFLNTLTYKNNCKQGIICYILEVKNDTPTLHRLYDPIIISSENINPKIRIKIDEYANSFVLSDRKFFIGIEWQPLLCKTEKKYKMFLETFYDIKENNLWTYNTKKNTWNKWGGGLSKADLLTPSISTIIRY